MGKFIGIWINNRKALVVSLEKGQEQHETHESHASRHIRLPGEPKGMSPHTGAIPQYHEDLRTYFNEILEIIKDAKAIFVFGPGKAKDNLKKAMMDSGELGSKIVGVEPADKMTAKQIVAKVKEYFFPKKTAAHAM